MGWGSHCHRSKKITLDPDRTSNENAVYNVADNSVTVTATAPKYTIMDWDTYLYEELTHIDKVTISRRPAGNFNDVTLIATLDNIWVARLSMLIKALRLTTTTSICSP